MITNADLTIYHYDKKSKDSKWVKKGPYKVWWYGGKGASYNKGLENANDVKIRIPKDINDISSLKVSVGDILVKGIVNKEILVQSDLKEYEDIYNVISFVDNNYGINKHLHIEGK